MLAWDVSDAKPSYPPCAVTPNYSVVGETPLRISDFYGVDGSREGRLRRNLRFLVVLREPVARTISSWEYKSERELHASSHHDEVPVAEIFCQRVLRRNVPSV